MKDDISPVLVTQAPHLVKLHIDMSFKKLFIADQISKKHMISTSLQQLSLRALFDTPNALLSLFRQLSDAHSLFKLEIDYLGTDPITIQVINGLQDALLLKNCASLRLLTLKTSRELLKQTFERKIREFDFGNIRVFKLVVAND